MDTAELTRQVMELRENEAATHEQLRTVFNRLDKQDALLETIHTLSANVGTVARGVDRLDKGMSAMRRDVDELKSRPGKRWEGVVTTAITVIVTAVITLMLSKTGIVP